MYLLKKICLVDILFSGQVSSCFKSLHETIIIHEQISVAFFTCWIECTWKIALTVFFPMCKHFHYFFQHFILMNKVENQWFDFETTANTGLNNPVLSFQSKTFWQVQSLDLLITLYLLIRKHLDLPFFEFDVGTQKCSFYHLISQAHGFDGFLMDWRHFMLFSCLSGL